MRARTMIMTALLAAGCPAPKQQPASGPQAEIVVEQNGEASHDKVFELDADALQGYYFEPRALNQPEMPIGEGLVKRSLDEQRKRYKKAKGQAKQTEGETLVILLWYTPPAATGEELKKALKAQRKEALAVLREMTSGGAVPERILHERAVAEEVVGEGARAQADFDALVTAVPGNLRYKALRDYYDLKENKPLTYPLGELGADAPYEAWYVEAWRRFRAADPAGAAEAITAAAMGWTNLETLAIVRTDVMVFLSRGGVPAEQALALVEELCGRDQCDLPGTIAGLSLAYQYAGEYDGAVKVIDVLAQGAAPARLADLRIQQAVLYYRLFRPQEAAAAALAALEAATAAGADLPPDLKETIATNLRGLAVEMHTEYTQVYDPALGAPAKKLYAAYLALPDRADADQVKEWAADLDTRMAKGLQEGEGQLHTEVLQRHIRRRADQAKACYERVLQANPALEGSVKLTFDIDEKGATTPVQLDPAPGADGMALVASCLEQRLKKWTFSKRPYPGISRVSWGVSYAPQKK